MTALGLQDRSPQHHSPTRQGKREAARNLVNRHFDAVASNVLRVGDTTEIDTNGGKLHPATVIALFSRHLLGYATGAHHEAAWVSTSLKLATATRTA